MTQGKNQAEQENRLLRKDSDAGGTVSAYDRDGVATEGKGDDDAPHHKTPPFPTNRDTLLDARTLLSEVYLDSEEIDVEGIHVLTVWIDYTVAEDGSVLSLIPEVRDIPGEDFVPIAVLDALISEVTLPGETPNYGSRTFYPTELRSSALNAGDRLRAPMAFDVGPYKQFRMRAAEITSGVAPGVLTLAANTSD